MTHQLTPNGIETDTLDQIIEELITRLHADISPGLNLNETSPLGSLIRILCERERSVVELAESVYAGSYPSSAGGFQLAQIGALSGTFFRPVTASFLGAADASVHLAAGITLPAGAVAHVNGRPDLRFVSVEDVNNPGGAPAWVPCSFEAEEGGPILCLAGELNRIAEPQPGWLGVINTADAIVGELQEEEAAFRIRRRADLYKGGSCSTSAIRASLLGDPRVRAAICLENKLDFTVPPGFPPHSVVPLIWDGADRFDPPIIENDEVAALIFEAVAGGIRIYGTNLGYATDPTGKVHPINFTRALHRPFIVEIDATSPNLYSEDLYPAGAGLEDAIRNVLVPWAQANLSIGDLVRYRQICRTVLSNVPGFYDFDSLGIAWVGDAPAPVNLQPDWDEVATLDSADITVLV